MLERTTMVLLVRVAVLCFLALSSLFAQGVNDSSRVRVDSLRLIPCGEVVGTVVYPSARVTVADTVAGWAKIYVEGWIPVESALPFFNRARLDIPAVGATLNGSPAVVVPREAEVRKQCEALTTKGKRCSRKAEKKSIYCWQHQLR